MLTLSDAIKAGQLQDFIAEREANGVGSITQNEFDEAVRRIAKQPQSEDRTSHSALGDDLTEK